MDTSALVAALIEGHEHHALARGHLPRATRLPAIVLAEAYGQLRRTFGQPASTAVAVLEPWTAKRQAVVATTPAVVSTVFGRAIELDLGGNVHDALIAETCRQHDLPLLTLDARQHRLALALGAQSTYLLA